MSVEVVYSGGRKGVLWHSIGTVAGIQIWSETHVSSSGGGGYVDKNGGFVQAPVIHSSVTDRSRYFLKSQDGKEVEILDGVAARNGHRVARVSGNISGGNGTVLALWNVDTGAVNFRVPAQGFWANYSQGKVYGWRLQSWLIAFVLLFFVVPELVFGGWSGRYLVQCLCVSAIGLLVCHRLALVKRNRRYASCRSELNDEALKYIRTIRSDV